MLVDKPSKPKYESVYFPLSLWAAFLKGKECKGKNPGDVLRDINVFFLYATYGKVTLRVDPAMPLSALLPEVKDHVTYSFNWCCPKCNRGWLVYDSMYIWKYCTYCGGEITVAKLCDYLVQEYLDCCATYILPGKIPSSFFTFRWVCHNRKEDSPHWLSLIGYTEDVAVWKYCHVCGEKLTIW
jgi:hypothetical protein